jgi:hypothetical protein
VPPVAAVENSAPDAFNTAKVTVPKEMLRNIIAVCGSGQMNVFHRWVLMQLAAGCAAAGTRQVRIAFA